MAAEFGESRRIDQPEPGYFRMRLVKGGWFVPCRIEYEPATGMWTTTIDDAVTSNVDPAVAGVFRVWLVAARIEEWQYLDMVHRREWRRTNEPDHPSLHPRKRMDPMRLRPQRVRPSVVRQP